MNGDPFIGMLETPVTSSPLVASFLSNLPAYRTGVSPLLRGVEVGLAHGFLIVGPFIKLGPLRNVEGVAEIAGCINGAALVLLLTACLSIYGSVTFQSEGPQVRALHPAVAAYKGPLHGRRHAGNHERFAALRHAWAKLGCAPYACDVKSGRPIRHARAPCSRHCCVQAPHVVFFCFCCRLA